MIVKLDLPRGMRDVQYEELRNISFIRDKFVETAEIFDFNQIEPSTLELLSTLEAKSGPSIIQETYSFTDKGGRDIALRFDLTIGLSRFVCVEILNFQQNYHHLEVSGVMTSHNMAGIDIFINGTLKYLDPRM